MYLPKWPLSFLLLIFAVSAFAQTWSDHSNNINEYRAKIKAKEEAIFKMIEEKKTVKDPKHLANLFQEILKQHKELVELNESLDKEITILKYRFPERGMAEERKYKRVRVPTVQEMEMQMSLDTQLDRALKTMDDQYETGKKAEPAAAPTPSPTPKPAREGVGDEGPIVIVK